MRSIYYIALFLAVFSLSSCEEKFDVDLNSADPRIVIEANLLSNARIQNIRVSRTVNFDKDGFDPLNDALVSVVASNGRTYIFDSQGEGLYRNNNFQLNGNLTYTLQVRHADQTYISKATMQPYVDIDSMGVTKEEIFRETYYFINLKFHDPAGIPNYYLYSLSINDEPFKFNMAMNDKFNDGQDVTHQLGGRNLTFKVGDRINIRRQLVSKEVYTYWNEFQATNPGSAAPGNPTGNISNNALGYFSVSNIKDYSVTIDDEDELTAGKMKAAGN